MSKFICLIILCCLVLYNPVFALNEDILVVLNNGRLADISIGSDSDGNIYTFETVAPMTTTETDGNIGFGYKLAVQKFDNTGNLTWSSSFPVNFNQDVYPRDMVVDNEGNIYLAWVLVSSYDLSRESGRFFRIQPMESLLLKISADGSLHWMRQLDFIVSSIDVDNEGYLYATGFTEWPFFNNYQNPMDTDTPQYTLHKFVICKLGKFAPILWYRTLNSSGNSQGISISYEEGHGIYVSGKFEGAVDFNPGTDSDIFVSQPDSDLSFICKYDEDGNYEWSNVIDLSEAGVEFELKDSCTDDDGVCYYSGYIKKAEDFVNVTGIDSDILIDEWGIYTGALNISGDPIWSDSFYFGDSSFALHVLTVDMNHNLYIGGTLSEPLVVSSGDSEFTFNAYDYGSPLLLVYESQILNLEKSRVWTTERYASLEAIEVTSSGDLVIGGWATDSSFLQSELIPANYIIITDL